MDITVTVWVVLSVALILIIQFALYVYGNAFGEAEIFINSMG